MAILVYLPVYATKPNNLLVATTVFAQTVFSKFKGSSTEFDENKP